MYYYLTKKMERQARGAVVHRMCLLSFEVLHGSDSQIIQDFSSLPFQQLCKVLRFRNEKDVHQHLSRSIQKSMLATFLVSQAKRTGFLAEVFVPQKREVIISVAGIEIATGTYSDRYISQWVYADTLGELTELVIKLSADCMNAQPSAKKHKYTSCKN
jgi:hypothetical protein